MISTLDHIILAVENLNEAEKNYKKIFGIDPVWRGEHKELGTANVIFNLKIFGKKRGVFLGDNGSNLIGFWVAWSAIYCSQNAILCTKICKEIISTSNLHLGCIARTRRLSSSSSSI